MGSTPAIHTFETARLHAALDARRTELALTWTGVAREIWAMSFELNQRRHDHPISPSTLTGLATRPTTSCQHALFMLRWLDRTPESFPRDASVDQARFALPLPARIGACDGT